MTDAGAAAEMVRRAAAGTPFAFQREVWAAMAAGRSGLLHATTGSGKTYAVWMGALRAAGARTCGCAQPQRRCGVLWLTPMRALAADTHARAASCRCPTWRRAGRSACAPATRRPAERARQDRRCPTALVTTPESLSLMLTRDDARETHAAACTP